MRKKFLDLLKDYITTATTAVLLPFYNFFGSVFELDKKGKIIILIALVFLTFCVALPFDYSQRRKRKKNIQVGLMELDKRRRDALESLLIHQKLAKDEFFRVKRIYFQDTIVGSDVYRIVDWSGINKHPKKKQATYFRGVIATGSSLDLFETTTRDELRNQQLFPRLIQASEKGTGHEWAVYEIRFQPIKYNHRAKFSHRPIAKGLITTSPSSISYLTGHFARGVGLLEGIIRFAKKPLSYSALRVTQSKSGPTYHEMPGDINLNPKQDIEGYYKLEFKIDNPPPLFIVEFHLK